MRGDGPGGVALRTGPSVDVTGEAVTNNRKGKLIPSYELHVKGTFSGEAGGSGGQAARGEGRWELPYLAEENAYEDPELRATAAGNAATQRVRDAFLASAKPVGYCRFPKQAPLAAQLPRTCSLKRRLGRR